MAFSKNFLVVIALLCLGLIGRGVEAQCTCVEILDEWSGNYRGDFSAQTSTGFTGLRVEVTFNNPIERVEFWDGTAEKIDDYHYVFTDDSLVAQPGDTIEFMFQAVFSGPQAVVVEARMNGEDVCGIIYTTEQPMTNPCEATGMTPYDYSQVLCMSILFYEAQRSGPLPADQRVTWRGDSALTDGADVGLDLTGGYYDAGDHVKFGFPMAYTATVLAWGLIDFADGYKIAGQTEYGLAAVKWATDYFLKAHSANYELYGQVGMGSTDHAYWGRPEEMTMERPSMKIDTDKPGSELAGETAAALAAASIAFKDVDSAYADEMLAVAKELYDFADEKRENYHKSIPDAAAYYQSWSGYGDELCWAALWLARATGDDTYLTRARGHWDEFALSEKAEQFSWDDKKPGVYALFTLLDGDNIEYSTTFQGFLDHIRNDKPYTPGGLVFLDTWGANRHAANVAFLALWAAKHNLSPEVNTQFAESQINYILGDIGHSFVVGYGVNPPERPHHRSSSCPDEPSSCTDGWAQQQAGPNPQILYGALVGGPAQDGTYKDDRMDYVHNEVACDYNAAFSGLLAAMVEIKSA
ncbi:endoglucanase E-4-like [Macrobrachium nipponense]|uniref:endoglucanase E-4-like n=1 Tax=Macrobrachium nipponense TaxID=159736 RepID=UPI0030C8CF8B